MFHLNSYYNYNEFERKNNWNKKILEKLHQYRNNISRWFTPKKFTYIKFYLNNFVPQSIIIQKVKYAFSLQKNEPFKYPISYSLITLQIDIKIKLWLLNRTHNNILFVLFVKKIKTNVLRNRKLPPPWYWHRFSIWLAQQTNNLYTFQITELVKLIIFLETSLLKDLSVLLLLLYRTRSILSRYYILRKLSVFIHWKIII